MYIALPNYINSNSPHFRAKLTSTNHRSRLLHVFIHPPQRKPHHHALRRTSLQAQAC